MMSTATTRARRSTMTTVIAIGIVATIGVDLAHAASGGSSHSAVAKHKSAVSAEQTYLKELRPIAIRVHNAVTPAELVMNAIIEPRAGDSYAARDALLHGEALTGLHSARVALQKLSAPAALAKQQHDLVTAAKRMEGALHGVRSLKSASGISLSDAISNFGDGNFSIGEGAWETALSSAYHRGHVATPPGLVGMHDRAPASRTAWIFGADRACSASTYQLGDVASLNPNHTQAGAEAFDRRWQTTLTRLWTKLKALPRPKGSAAVPTALSMRLRVIHYNASLFTEAIRSMQKNNVSLLEKAQSQFAQIDGSLRGLATQFNRYGAGSCGLVIDYYGGKKPTVPGHGSTVNT